MMENHDADALAPYAGRYDLIRLTGPNELCKGKPGGKQPSASNWRLLQPLSFNEARAHFATRKNIGVRLRNVDLVLDVDPRHGGNESLERLAAELGIDFADWPIVWTGSGGRHIYMKKPDDVRVAGKVPGHNGIDVKTVGGFVVSSGSVHANGAAYRWDDDPLSVPLSQVSDAPNSLIELLRRPECPVSDAPGEIDADDLAKLLGCLDVCAFGDELAWREIMMASHHATNGAGIDVFVEWSLGDLKYVHAADDIRTRWNSLAAKPDGIKAGTLFKAVVDAGHPELVKTITASNDFAGIVEDKRGQGAIEETSSQAGFAEQYVWIADAERFIRRKDGKALSEKQFKSLYADKWPEGDILTAVWKGKLPIRRLESMAYVPLADEFTRSPGGVPIYNTWRDSRINPVKGDVAVFLDHMAYLFPDEAERSFVIDYLALLVQRPETKINFALLVRGRQGTGKSWIGLLAARMIGEDNVGRPMNSVVVDKYTDWQEGRQLVIIEELMALGRQEVANRLKPVITDSQLCIRPIYGRAYNLPNHLNLICFTNHADALPIEADDRRWLAVFSPAEPATEVYYDRLFGFLDAGGAAAVAHWLLARQIELNPKGRAPWTSGKEEMRGFTLGEAEQVLAELMAEGSYPFDFELVRLEDVVASVPDRIARGSKGLRSRVIKWLKDEVKAVKHARYTKQGNDGRQPWSLWSIRNHSHWDGAGAAARIDAYLKHIQS